MSQRVLQQNILWGLRANSKSKYAIINVTYNFQTKITYSINDFQNEDYK
jgi:hypothetical protein